MSIGDAMSLRVNTRSGVRSHRQLQHRRSIGIDACYCPRIEETFPGGAGGRTGPEWEGSDVCIGDWSYCNRRSHNGVSTMNAHDSSAEQ